MNGFGEHSLAGTTLTQNQYRGVVGFGGFAGHFQHLDGGGIVSDDMSKIIAALFRFHRITHPHAQSQHLGGTMQNVRHVVEMKGFNQIVKSAQLHGFDGALHQMVGAHHDHDRGRIRFA